MGRRPAVADAPLRVGYDATAAFSQRAGIGRYARELLVGLSRLASADRFEVVVLHPRLKDRGSRLDVQGPIGQPAVGSGPESPRVPDRFFMRTIPASERLMNLVWQRLALPIPVELRTGRLDVFHCPDFSAPPALAPQLMTVHDLAFEVVPHLAYPTLAAYLHRIVPRGVKRSQAVITPSQCTKEAMVSRLGTAPEKIHVIPEGVSSAFGPHDIGRDGDVVRDLGLDGDYLLTVGTLEPRKNLERLLDVFSALRGRKRDLTLTIVGRRGWMYEGLAGKLDAMPDRDRVVVISDAGDDQLASLLRRAALTVQPALYEGFGLPVLEALACGSPLACSGNSAFPEIAGECAAYFDPWDTEDMVETLDGLLADDSHREQLRVCGPKRAQPYTWARTAEATSVLYHDVARR